MRWFTERARSVYGLAVTRILIGATVSLQLIFNASDRAYTWGAGARWATPLRDGGMWPEWLGFYVTAPPVVFDLLYIATIVVSVSLTVGFLTRTSSVLTLALWMPLATSNPMIETGGDGVLRMVLLYLCFTEAGRHLSVDARRRSRRDLDLPAAGRWDWLRNTLNNLALILIIHQIITVYVASSLWKVQGRVWLDGTAVYFPLNTENYSPWLDLLGPLYAWAPFVLGATWVSTIIQLAVPVLLLFRPTRVAAFLAITLMHVGIGLLMGIMFFSMVMIAADAVLISDGSWRRLIDWLAGRWRPAPDDLKLQK